MPSSYKDVDSGIITKTINLTAVKGIRGYVYSYADSSKGPNWWNGKCYIYEIEAFSTKIYKSVTFHLAKKVLGKMKDWNASLEDDSVTSGTWTAPSTQLDPSSLKTLNWNELLVGTDDIEFYVRTGTTKTLCEAAAWIGPFTDSNSQPLDSVTSANWVQYKIEFSCTNTTVNNPRVFSANGFLVKITYSKGAEQAEANVEFIYDTGFRHFDEPMLDKIFQKIAMRHEGVEGSFLVYWETENDSGQFQVDLNTSPKSWSSFFPSNAFGKLLKLKIYKNDIFAFKLKEIQGVYSPQPLIL